MVSKDLTNKVTFNRGSEKDAGLIPPDIWENAFQAEESAKALGLESLESRDYSREAKEPGGKSKSKWKSSIHSADQQNPQPRNLLEMHILTLPTPYSDYESETPGLWGYVRPNIL